MKNNLVSVSLVIPSESGFNINLVMIVVLELDYFQCLIQFILCNFKAFLLLC